MSINVGVDYNARILSLGFVENQKVLATARVDLENLLQAIDVLQALLKSWGAKEIWIEQPWVNGSKFPRSGLMMTRSATVVEVASLQIGVEPQWVHPMTWRKEIYGNARIADKKAAAVKFVEDNFDYKVPTLGLTPRSKLSDHNLAEAILIAHYGGLTK